MKMNFKNTFLTALAAFSLTGCVSDDDTTLPPADPLSLSQKFEGLGADGDLLVIPGWINYNEAGAAKWMLQQYSGNSYAEFNPYASGDVTNVGWLISPAFSLEGSQNKLSFKVSQSFVSSAANSLEVVISTDFDGTNVLGATWTTLPAEVPGPDAEYFLLQRSQVDLSAYAGAAKLYLAFKVKGSGTNQALDGAYQIDNVTVY